MVNFYCVCKFCGHHEKENAVIEINFRDNSIYYYCTQCKKENCIKLEKMQQPLPRAKTI